MKKFLMVVRVMMVGVMMVGLLSTLTVAADEPIDDREEWRLIDSQDGIDTYQKALPGTDVCDFMAVGFVDAGLETIGAVLTDTDAYPGWMPNFKEARVLKEIERHKRVLYIIASVPWPYRNREVVVVNDTVQDFENGLAVITFTALPEHPLAPPSDRHVRITELKGRYVLEYFGRNKSRVTYQHRVDPGGNVPVGLANRFAIRYDPYRIITGLRQMAAQEKYIEAGRNTPEYELIEAQGRDPEQVRIVLENRLGAIMTDKVLLEKIFRMNDTVAYVFEQKTSHESIKKAIMDLFHTFVTPHPELEKYVQDRQLEDFIRLDKLLKERWLAEPLSRDRALLEKFLNNGNNMLEKVLACRRAVDLFVDDADTAARIVDDASLRRRILADEGLKKEIMESLDQLEQPQDIGEMIKARLQAGF